jgi:hypothetical protein
MAGPILTTLIIIDKWVWGSLNMAALKRIGEEVGRLGLTRADGRCVRVEIEANGHIK